MEHIPIIVFALFVFVFIATDIGSSAIDLLYAFVKSFFSNQYVTRV